MTTLQKIFATGTTVMFLATIILGTVAMMNWADARRWDFFENLALTALCSSFCFAVGGILTCIW